MDRYRCGICGYVYNPEKGEARNKTAQQLLKTCQTNGSVLHVERLKEGLKLPKDPR